MKVTRTKEKVTIIDGRRYYENKTVYVNENGEEFVKHQNDWCPLQRSTYSNVHRIGFGYCWYRQTAFDKTTTVKIIKK
jgi:hypothetical protein